MNNNKISFSELSALAAKLAAELNRVYQPDVNQALKIYPIPRGGVPAALAVAQHIPLLLVDSPEQADVFIDDVVNSGATRNKWKHDWPEKEFYALIDKKAGPRPSGWIVFPWEGDVVGSFDDNIVKLLQFVGEDPSRVGLKETPTRVTKAWQYWCSGYGKDPKDILKVFEGGAEKHNQTITVQDIPIYSHCEHHLTPIFGTCTISYAPNGKIIGLSKLSRLADIFARRLQVQERMTNQIADALFTHLEPMGVGVVIKARHLCMESRGVCQQGHQTVTTALRGIIKDDATARTEFMRLA
ncbi:GTP cyclohydrolase I FolE [Sinorhizobium chiapasense]|uniref:GTP cyclohydrolase 1 n=1 Tax=Sinorhizobium chiapasense TaxID=501572 RepID=A0ABZ2BGI6_9HYPH